MPVHAGASFPVAIGVATSGRTARCNFANDATGTDDVEAPEDELESCGTGALEAFVAEAWRRRAGFLSGREEEGSIDTDVGA